MLKAIDTHAHLDHVENVEQALQDAVAAGVEGIVALGMDLNSNKRNLEIKKKTVSPRIYLGLGIHPANIVAEEVEATIAFIREHIRDAHAIGEIGMDFWYKGVKKDEAKKEEQRQVFRRQLLLAQEYRLPVVIHSRGTWQECLDMAREAGIQKAVFHWYSGPLDVLENILAEGYLVSASPALAYSPQSREAIQHAPIEQTLIETDCPVFYNYPEGGFSSQPKDVFKTLEAYARLKQVNAERALEILNHNAKKFFSLN